MIKYSCPEEIWIDDKKFGDTMHLIAISHYHQVFGKLNINTTDGNELDRRFAIDCIGEGKLKNNFYLQEKFRTHGMLKKYGKQITIEYMSNVEYKTKGAFFTLNIDYYVYGYASTDNVMFEHLWVLKWNQFKAWFENHFTEEGVQKLLQFNHKHGCASFLAIPIEWIPFDVIKYEYHKGNTLFGFSGD